jgi:hypothetical protein
MVIYMLIFWTLSIVLAFKARLFIDWISLRHQASKIRGLLLLAFSKGPNRVRKVWRFWERQNLKMQN